MDVLQDVLNELAVFHVRRGPKASQAIRDDDFFSEFAYTGEVPGTEDIGVSPDAHHYLKGLSASGDLVLASPKMAKQRFWKPLEPLVRALFRPRNLAKLCKRDCGENGSACQSDAAAWVAFPVAVRGKLAWKYYVNHTEKCPAFQTFRARIGFAAEKDGREKLLITTELVSEDPRLLPYGLHISKKNTADGTLLPTISVDGFKTAWKDVTRIHDTDYKSDRDAHTDLEQPPEDITGLIDKWREKLLNHQPSGFWTWVDDPKDVHLAGLPNAVLSGPNRERALNYLIWLELLGPGWSELYTLPIHCLDSDLKASVVLCTRRRLEAEEIAAVRAVASILYSQMAFADVRELTRERDARARWAASAAVMGRNMSHNIGSHVLASLSRWEDVLKDRKDSEGKHPEDCKEGAERIAQFNRYLRTRMDFIADAATAANLVPVPMRLYSDCVSYFQPAGDEGITEMPERAQQLLLDRISGDANFTRKCLSLEVLRDDGVDQVVINARNLAKDLWVALPNGQMGCHALYSILENVIRNTVKHEGAEHRVALTLDVRTDGGFPESDALYRVALVVDRPGDGKVRKGLVDELNEHISGPDSKLIREDDGEVRYKWWGLKEMKICAAYLRGVSADHLDDDDLNRGAVAAGRAPLLTALKTTDGKLAYEFYLQQPQLLAIADPNDTLASNLCMRTTELSHAGLLYLDREALSTLKSSHKSLAHEILLIVNTDEQADPAEVLGWEPAELADLPVRIVRANSETCAHGMGGDHDSDIVGALRDRRYLDAHLLAWKRWLKTLTGGIDWTFAYRAEASAGGVEWGTRVETREDLSRIQVPALYDSHGEFSKEMVQRALDGNGPLFYEPFNQPDPAFAVVMKPPASLEAQQAQVCRLVEAGATRIVVLDERVQKAWEDKREYPNITEQLGYFLQLMNVFVPKEVEVNLEAPGRTRIEAFLKDRASGAHFLVVHQAVLEKLEEHKDEAERVASKYAWLTEKCEDLGIRTVVIDSGRGTPPGIDGGSRFIPVSNLLTWTVEQKSKFHLSQLLYASRRPRHGDHE